MPSKNIPVFVPYFDQTEKELIAETLDSGWVSQGPATATFESLLAKCEKASHAAATTSATTALHVALLAMGVTKDHDVLVPSFTFVATANAVEYIGATAVLVDVNKETFNIDTDYLQTYIEQNYVNGVNKRTNKTLWGVIPVGLFGLLASMPQIAQICQRYGINALEDNACSLGSSINNIHGGGFGYPSVLSFHARKSITTGEGGAIITNDDTLAQKIRELRSHSASVSEITRHLNHGFLMPEYNSLGYNYRLSDIQGAMGIGQMKKLDYMIEQKRKLAKRYDEIIAQELAWLIPQKTPTDYFHTYQSYVCRLDYHDIEKGTEIRTKIMAYLEEKGIGTRQGTHAVHMLGYYRDKYGYQKEDLAGAYACDKLSIAIPMYVSLTEDDQDYVVEQLKKARELYA